MKLFSPTLFIPLLLVLFLLPLRANNVYILFNPACMDRLEYAYGFTPEGQEYVKYHVKISPTEVLIFEVGPENNAPKQNYLSGTPLECDDDQLNKELVYRQRGDTDEVFIVRQLDSGQYQVSKVNASSYFRRDAKGVQYDSWQMNFNHLGGLKEGDNLTPNNATGVTVIYEGLQPYECTEAYVFKQTYEFDANAYRERFFIPNIGIVEDRSVPGGPDGVYKLRRVNGEPFERYLQKVCQSGIALNSNFLNAANGGSAAGNNLTYQGPAHHEVEKGETLFSISRTYGVSVEDLRNWNNMNDVTMLRVGQRLRVLPPATASNTPTAAAAQSNSFSWNGQTPPADAGGIQPYNPGGNTSTAGGIQPFTPGGSNARGSIQPYSSNGGNSAANDIQPFSPGGPSASNATAAKGANLKPWESTSGTHTVKAGETVALLALRYGYTEDRFRHMNDLGPNDILKVGQNVKTTDCPPASNMGSSIQGNFTPRSGAGPAPAGTSNPTGSNSMFNYNNSGAITGNSPSVPATNAPTARRAPGNSTLPAPSANATNPPPVNPGSNNAAFEPYNGGSTPDFSNLSSDPFNNNATGNPGIYPNTDASQGQPSGNPTGANTPAGATLPTYNNPGGNPSPQPYQPGGGIQPYTPGGAPSSTAPAASPAQPSPFGTPLSPSSNSLPENSNTPTYRTNSMPLSAPPAGNSPTLPQSYNTSNASGIQPYTPPGSGSSATGNPQQRSYKTTHVVREGETLDSIAKQYNTSSETLRQINNIDANEILIPYQKIYIN